MGDQPEVTPTTTAATTSRALLIVAIENPSVEGFMDAQKRLGDFLNDVPENTTWAGFGVTMYGAIGDVADRIMEEFHA